MFQNHDGLPLSAFVLILHPGIKGTAQFSLICKQH